MKEDKDMNWYIIESGSRIRIARKSSWFDFMSNFREWRRCIDINSYGYRDAGYSVRFEENPHAVGYVVTNGEGVVKDWAVLIRSDQLVGAEAA